MPDLGKPPTAIQKSRRHLIKMGTIAASAVFARLAQTKSAHAQTTIAPPPAPPTCFLKGTTIRVAEGDRKVEDLSVGDLLPTVFSGMRPIQWIGRYRYRKSDPAKSWVRNVMPIRIARSALGPNIPHANLYLSEEHALLIDGVLVAAANLVNDTTITRYDARDLDELEFFHIKLERHDVIYAEGAPSETLLKVDESAVNFADYLRQYGPVTAEEIPCAPVFRYGYRRGEIKSSFRSAISPWMDFRQPVDIIRDKLDDRGIALVREAEFIS